MAAVEIKRFEKADTQLWDDFVEGAKNATFLFNRGYMDYHADRFVDHSLLLYNEGRLKALFVANEANDEIVSHGGLSYGGLVLEKEARLEEVLCWFFHIGRYYHQQHFKRVIYKCLPFYYATYPSQEDLYALFLLKASLIQRDTSSVCVRSMPLPYQQRRRKNTRENSTNSYRIIKTNDPREFWNTVLIPNLRQRFGAEPVHSVVEMQTLMERFPNHIQFFAVYDKEIVGGTVIYCSGSVAHAQYTSATILGKELGVLDVLFHHLLTDVFNDKAYFSFGTSNGDLGRQLNRGLVNWKEGFGARTFTIDYYQIETENYSLLESYA
jgi:hypothetical protein